MTSHLTSRLKGAAATNFRTECCLRLGCSETEYTEAVFWHCLYGHARPLVRGLRRIAPKLFADDLDLVRQVAKVQTLAEFRREVDYFRYLYPPDGILRQGLRIRLSIRKLKWLASETISRNSEKRNLANTTVPAELNQAEATSLRTT